jgi:hypothetical protein
VAAFYIGTVGRTSPGAAPARRRHPARHDRTRFGPPSPTGTVAPRKTSRRKVEGWCICYCLILNATRPNAAEFESLGIRHRDAFMSRMRADVK